MKVIDLLNKIANGEEVPKKIAIQNEVLIYNEDEILNLQDCYYMVYEEDATWRIWAYELNDEVEILEEEKEIPEKLNWKPKESMAGQLTQKEQIEVIARRTEKLKKEFNNLLDYLKSKGE